MGKKLIMSRDFSGGQTNDKSCQCSGAYPNLDLRLCETIVWPFVNTDVILNLLLFLSE